MNSIRPVLAITGRNLTLLRRRKDLLAQAVLVPIVLLTLCALIFGAGGDDWPVAVVDNSHSPQSTALIQSINDTKSRITPYFRIIQTDPAKADKMIGKGRLQLSIEIPADFATSHQVHISTYNINSDATKNLRLRVDDALNNYDNRSGNMQAAVDLRTVKRDDIPRTEFIAGSVLLLALFFGAALLAANLFAIEVEGRTTKEILMSPVGPGGAAVGAMLAGTLGAFGTTLPTYLIARYAFGLTPPWGAFGLVLLFMIPLMFACAALGVVLAHLLRLHRTIQPLVILTGIATFFAAGGFVSVPGLPPIARTFAEFWPFSRIFQWNNPVLYRFADHFPAQQWGWAVAIAAVGLLAALWAGRRERALPQRGGQ